MISSALIGAELSLLMPGLPASAVTFSEPNY